MPTTKTSNENESLLGVPQSVAKNMGLSGSALTFRKASANSGLRIDIRSAGKLFLKVTSYVETWVALRRTGIGSVSLVSPSFFSLLLASNEKSTIIRALSVTTAANGETLKLGISCAADFCCITKCFWRLTSSPSFFWIVGRCSVALPVVVSVL